MDTGDGIAPQWPLFYWRFALSLILYTGYVMVFPLATGWSYQVSFLALVPVALATTGRQWNGLLLAVVNIPVTALLASRTGSLATAAEFARYAVPLATALVLGWLGGALVERTRAHEAAMRRLARLEANADYLHAELGSGIELVLREIDHETRQYSANDGQSVDMIAEPYRLELLPTLFRLAHSRQTPHRTELREFIPTLVGLFAADSGPNAWDLDIEACAVAPATAALIGLALSEPIRNSLSQRGPAGVPVTITLALSVEDDEIRIELSDDGPGFPDPVLERHTHANGGLGVAYRIIRRFHGSLTLRNRNGACCILGFPVTLILS